MDLESASREQLIGLVLKLRRTLDLAHAEKADLRARNRELAAKVEDLNALVDKLKERIAELERSQARQAAPFRRPDAKKVPADQRKRPGRPAGHPGANRPIPAVIDETVTAPLERCPGCGGNVVEVVERTQLIEDIPVVRPKVTKIVTFTGRCGRCGRVESRHPLQT